MADFEIGTNDREPPLTATLTRDGSAVNLTGRTVDVYIGGRDETPIVAASASVTNGSAGEIQYSWSAGDTDTPGVYAVIFVVDEGTATQSTFPDEGAKSLKISDEVQKS